MSADQTSMTTSNRQCHLLGVDLGMGAIKLWDSAGGVQLPSFVALGGQAQTMRMAGLTQRPAPLQVTIDGQAYFAGLHAHDFGRPLEALDYARLTGSPEIRALFCGALTRRIQQHGAIAGPLTCLVGMPLEPLTGDQAKETVAAMRKWMKGIHRWMADGEFHEVMVEEVRVTSQPAGALFDYLLDDRGSFHPARKADMQKELGILSIGFNTLELMAMRDRAPVQRFTAGSTAGVRRLLEVINQEGHYSLGELDANLRAGGLDLDGARAIWAREVNGAIERRWGSQWRRFGRIILVGGGALLLGQELTERFDGKLFVPDEPVLAIARGLYKQALLFQGKRKEE